MPTKRTNLRIAALEKEVFASVSPPDEIREHSVRELLATIKHQKWDIDKHRRRINIQLRRIAELRNTVAKDTRRINAQQQEINALSKRVKAKEKLAEDIRQSRNRHISSRDAHIDALTAANEALVDALEQIAEKGTGPRKLARRTLAAHKDRS